MAESLSGILFPDDGEHTYAVVDGAACEELLDKLDTMRPASVCLYAGEIEPDVEAVAPYLVALTLDHPFTGWLLSEGFGKHWCVFARSPENLRALRRHFRTLLLIRDPAGKSLYFRYYDPRVLGFFLPLCDAVQLAAMFGPISAYAAESDDGAALRRFTHAEGQLASQTLKL